MQPTFELEVKKTGQAPDAGKAHLQYHHFSLFPSHIPKHHCALFIHLVAALRPRGGCISVVMYLYNMVSDMPWKLAEAECAL